MKKILCLVMVLILAMSVSTTAFAAEDALAGLGSFEMPNFASISEAFDALAEFLKFDAIMVYVYEFHTYMSDFYKNEFDPFLRAMGAVINGILTGLFAAGSFPM